VQLREVQVLAVGRDAAHADVVAQAAVADLTVDDGGRGCSRVSACAGGRARGARTMIPLRLTASPACLCVWGELGGVVQATWLRGALWGLPGGPQHCTAPHCTQAWARTG